MIGLFLAPPVRLLVTLLVRFVCCVQRVYSVYGVHYELISVLHCLQLVLGLVRELYLLGVGAAGLLLFLDAIEALAELLVARLFAVGILFVSEAVVLADAGVPAVPLAILLESTVI